MTGKSPTKKAIAKKAARKRVPEETSAVAERVERWKDDFIARGGQILRGIHVQPDAVAAKEALKEARGFDSDTKLINALLLEAHKRLRTR